MGRKRKNNPSSAAATSPNPFASPRSSSRKAKRRAAHSGPGATSTADLLERNPWVLAAVCAALLLATFLAFRPALDKDVDFVNLDDNRYVYDNVHVVQGLTRDTIAWAFTSLEYDNWHPLTWISYMLDREISGPEVLRHARAYHFTNLLIHAINVVVLFLALRRLTSALWPSLLVAVLFGLHPLRAESVAWISERKDVLSGLFFFLTLWAYAAYAEHSRSWMRYGLVIVLFLIGLSAKPMLVSLPVLLLLLDYWPLRRLRLNRLGPDRSHDIAAKNPSGNPETPMPSKGSKSGSRTASKTENPPVENRGPSWTRIVLEKAPLFALALTSSAVTVMAQQGAMKVIDTITFPMRLENALVSYATYIGEVFYPVNLAPLYPFPEHGVPWTKIAAATIVLAAITALVVRLRDWRWLAVGWFWYLVALLPVIGLVQVGVQAMADRYTYLPHIGLFIMLAWTAEALTVNMPVHRWIWAAALLMLTAVLVQATAAQTATWKNNEIFWGSALKSNPEIALAENNLGYIVERRGELDEALKRYTHAVQIRPRYVEAQINLGNVYMRKAQTLKPMDVQMFNNLIDEGLKHYRTAIEVRPDFELSYVNLGTGLMLRGDFAEAEANFRTALKIAPNYAEAYAKLGEVLRLERKFDEGIASLRKAVELNPQYYPAWQMLAQSLKNLGRYDESIACCEVLLNQPATAPEAMETLGYNYYAKHEPRKALQYWMSYLDNNPDSLPVLTMTAWLLATDPDPAVRDGGKALALAQRAVKLSQARDPRVLAALAAATAENGDFAAAARTIDQARRMPNSGAVSDATLLELQRRYESGSRYLDGLGLLLMTPSEK